MKHGWKPFLTTNSEIYGSTRPEAYTSMGKLEKNFKKEDFKEVLKNKKEDFFVVPKIVE